MAPRVYQSGRSAGQAKPSQGRSNVHTFESILGAAQAGAEWAWRALYDEYFAPLVGYFRAQGSRDPEDLAGDVLMRMSRTIQSFHGTETKFRSWVFTIAHNRLIDERRSRTRKPEHLEAEPGDQQDPMQTEAVAMERLGADWVLAALDQLSADQREVLTLRILAGLSLPEIATATGKGVGAVKQLQRRGLKRLAKQFEGDPYPFGHSGRSP